MFKYLEDAVNAVKLCTPAGHRRVGHCGPRPEQPGDEVADVARERHRDARTPAHRRRADVPSQRVLHPWHGVPVPDAVRCRHVEGRRQDGHPGGGAEVRRRPRQLATRSPAQQRVSGDLLERPDLHRVHAGHDGRPWEELDAVPRPATDGARRRPGRHAARPDVGRLDRLPLADVLRSDRSRRQQVLRALPVVAAVVRAGWDADARRPHAPVVPEPAAGRDPGPQLLEGRGPRSGSPAGPSSSCCSCRRGADRPVPTRRG